MLKGDAGQSGQRGDQGLQGPPGVGGLPGQPGEAGRPGSPGRDGEPGGKGDVVSFAIPHITIWSTIMGYMFRNITQNAWDSVKKNLQISFDSL